MKNIQIIIAFLISLNLSYSQVNPLDVEIVRDNYGVPHIYGKTDADVAYGLAWAHSEDDFKTIQEAYLAGNGLLSKHIGIKGAPVDFISQLIRSDYVVDSLFETIDKKFMKIAEAYAQGFNKFAELNPDQVLVKKLFPLQQKKC
jgi:acyl-homoserine-lactone acylase